MASQSEKKTSDQEKAIKKIFRNKEGEKSYTVDRDLFKKLVDLKKAIERDDIKLDLKTEKELIEDMEECYNIINSTDGSITSHQIGHALLS